jgi:translation elongation factor EF-G
MSLSTSARVLGSYSMTLSHYELVPPNVQQQIIAQYAKKKEED